MLLSYYHYHDHRQAAGRGALLLSYYRYHEHRQAAGRGAAAAHSAAAHSRSPYRSAAALVCREISPISQHTSLSPSSRAGHLIISQHIPPSLSGGARLRSVCSRSPHLSGAAPLIPPSLGGGASLSPRHRSGEGGAPSAGVTEWGALSSSSSSSSSCPVGRWPDEASADNNMLLYNI